SPGGRGRTPAPARTPRCPTRPAAPSHRARAPRARRAWPGRRSARPAAGRAAQHVRLWAVTPGEDLHETLRRIERAAGALATASVARMDEVLPWFRELPADQRAWVMIVAQTGVRS